MELTNHGKWLLGSTLISVASILFVIAWTAPFWPPSFGWLSLPLVKTIFPIVVMIGFVVLFLYGIIVLSKTEVPPFEVLEPKE